VPTFGQSVTFRDDKGQTASVRWYVTAATQADAATDAAAQVGFMAALSNAAVQSVRGASNMSPAAVVYGTNADYEDIEDKASFVFETAAGSIHRYQIPAPKASIFLADGETIDFTNAAVATFVSNWIGLGPGPTSDRDGNGLAVSVGGTRTRVRQQRRFSTITRNPTLTGQGL
jgi:redox-sensitive bicupin YhaK (pirin superfamily)